MKTVRFDDILLRIMPTHKDPNAVLIRKLEKEYKVKFRLYVNLSHKLVDMGFVLFDKPSIIYLKYGLKEQEFNYTAFHEVRHVQQARSRSFMLHRKSPKGADVVRYLMDCISCELDADIFSVRECAARMLPSARPGYLGSSKKYWKKLVRRYAIEQCDGYTVTPKALRTIVNLIKDPIRRK